MNGLSAEAAVRQLRAPGHAHGEKLAVAVAVWRDAAVVIPRKDRFLLDWISRELMGSTDRARAVVDGTQGQHQGLPAALNADSWTLFREVLAHVLADSDVASRTGGAAGASAAVVVNPSILAPLGVAFGACCRPTGDSTEEPAKKRKGDGGNAVSQSDGRVEVNVGALSTSLLAVQRALIARSDVFVPRFESFASFVESLLNAFLSSPVAPPCDACDFFAESLAAYAAVQRQQPNQRKVFSLFVPRLLTPFLVLHNRSVAKQAHDVPARRLASLASAIVTQALFHKDHVGEYASALTVSDEFLHGTARRGNAPAAVVSYPRVVFEQLANDMGGGVRTASAPTPGVAHAPQRQQGKKRKSRDSEGPQPDEGSNDGAVREGQPSTVYGDARDAIVAALPFLLDGFLSASQSQQNDGHADAPLAGAEAAPLADDEDGSERAVSHKGAHPREKAREAAESARSFRRRVRFAVFLELCGLLRLDDSAMPLESKTAALRSLDAMLATVGSRGVYAVADDNRDGQPQFRWLASLLGGLLCNWSSGDAGDGALARAAALSQGVASAADACIAHVIALNHAAAEPLLPQLWRVVAAGGQSTGTSAFPLTVSRLFATYVKLRKMDALCGSLLEAVAQSGDDVRPLSAMLGMSHFQREYTAAIRAVPVALIPAIWSVHTAALAPLAAITGAANQAKKGPPTSLAALLPAARLFALVMEHAPVTEASVSQHGELVAAARASVMDPLLAALSTSVSAQKRSKGSVASTASLAASAADMAEAALVVSAAAASALLLNWALARAPAASAAWPAVEALLCDGELCDRLLANTRTAHALRTLATSAGRLLLTVAAISSATPSTSSASAPNAKTARSVLSRALDILVLAPSFASGANDGVWSGAPSTAHKSEDAAGALWHVAGNLSLVLRLADSCAVNARSQALNTVAERLVAAYVDGSAPQGPVSVSCHQVAASALSRPDALEHMPLQTALVAAAWRRALSLSNAKVPFPGEAADDAGACVGAYLRLLRSVDVPFSVLEGLTKLVSLCLFPPLAHLPPAETARCVGIAVLCARAALAVQPAEKEKEKKRKGKADGTTMATKDLGVRIEALRMSLRLIARASDRRAGVLRALSAEAGDSMLSGIMSLCRALCGEERSSLLRRVGRLLGSLCRDAILSRFEAPSDVQVAAFDRLFSAEGDELAEVAAVALREVEVALRVVLSRVTADKSLAASAMRAHEAGARIVNACARMPGAALSDVGAILPSRHSVVRCMSEVVKSSVALRSVRRAAGAGDGSEELSVSADVLRACSIFLLSELAAPAPDSGALGAAVAYMDAACHVLSSGGFFSSPEASSCLAADAFNLVVGALLRAEDLPWLLASATSLFASYVSHANADQLSRVADAIRGELEKAAATGGAADGDGNVAAVYAASAALRCATVVLTLPLTENKRHVVRRHIMPLCAVIPSVVASLRPNGDAAIPVLASVTCGALEAVEAAAMYEGMELKGADIAVALEAVVSGPLFGAQAVAVAALSSASSSPHWLRIAAGARAGGSAAEEDDGEASVTTTEGADVVEVFVFRCYRLLRALLRRHADPVYDQIHVFLAAVRHLLAFVFCRFGVADDDVADGETSHASATSGVRCVENLSRLLQELSTHKAASSKYAPYLLGDYLEWTQRRPLPLSLRRSAHAGVYALLDMCTEHEQALLMAVADAPTRALLQSLHADYSKYHKYSGKV